MGRIFCGLFITCWAIGAGASRAAAPATAPAGPEEVRVFEPKEMGYTNCRIPGIAMTTKGTLLAWCEARHAKGGDWDPIDILLRRSTDGGRTWGEVQHIAGGGKRTYNNPVAIVDREGGGIHFLYCVEYARCFAMHSDDDGRTFSEPVEITGTFEALKKDYAWNVIATGPCHGIQLRTGRLLVPVWLSTGGHSHRPSVVATICSDDHGRTWRAGSIAVQNTKEVPNPNETVAVELADGRVMLNCRNESPRHRRVIVTSPDGATGWTAPAFDVALVEPICNAAIVRVNGAPPDGRSCIVFANPNNDAPPEPGRAKPPVTHGVAWFWRRNLTLRVSYDEGRTWPVSKALDPGVTDYCDLAGGPDGMVYCLHSVAKGLTLARVPLDWLGGP